MIEISLIFISIASALMFGSVETWAIAIIGVITSVLFAVVVMRAEGFGKGFSDAKGILYAMMAIFLYAAFQLLPLPLSITGKLQPGIMELLTLSPAVTPFLHSISIYPFATETELARLVVYLMIFSLAAFGIRNKKGAYGIIKALSVFGFVLALFAIVQYATGNGKLYWARSLSHGGEPFGPFVNRNHFAGFVNMIAPISLGISLMSRSKEKKILYSFFSVVMVVSVFLSLSKGGIISFFAGIIVFSFVIFTSDRSRESLVKLIPVFFFMLILVVYLLFVGISPVIERFLNAEVSNAQRLSAWQGTISAFRDFPVFGSGLGTFQYIFNIYKGEGLYKYWEHAHNDYLELLLETGVTGFIIGGLFFFFVFRTIVGEEWREKKIYLKAGIFSSAATIAVHSLVDFNLHIPSNAILMVTILGCAVSLGNSGERALKEKRMIPAGEDKR